MISYHKLSHAIITCKLFNFFNFWKKVGKDRRYWEKSEKEMQRDKQSQTNFKRRTTQKVNRENNEKKEKKQQKTKITYAKET